MRKNRKCGGERVKETVFLDTTKLEKIRNCLIGASCITVILIMFFWKMSDHSIMGFSSRFFLEEHCMFEDYSHPAIFLTFFV